MRTVGVGVTDALQHRNLTLVVHILYLVHTRVETNFVIYSQHLVRADLQICSVIHVMGVAIRNKCVQGVVGSCHLKYYQDRVFLVGGHRLLLSNLSGCTAPTDRQTRNA